MNMQKLFLIGKIITKNYKAQKRRRNFIKFKEIN